MPHLVNLSFPDSGRSVSTCCTHSHHYTVAELIQCAVQSAFFLCPDGVEYDVLSCEAHVSDDDDLIVDVWLPSKPHFPSYDAVIRLRTKEALTTCSEDTAVGSRPSLSDLPQPQYSDVTIQVGRETVRTSSALLFEQSSYFRDIFRRIKNSEAKSTIILTGVNSTEFAEFLLALNSKDVSVNARNVVLLTKMADRFGAASIMDRCSAFLRTSTMPVAEKLFLIDQLSVFAPFPSIRDELLKSLPPNVLEALVHSLDFRKLSGNCQAELRRLSSEWAEWLP